MSNKTRHKYQIASRVEVNAFWFQLVNYDDIETNW